MSPRALTCLAAAAAPATRAPPSSRTETGTIQAGAEPPVAAEAIAAAAARPERKVNDESDDQIRCWGEGGKSIF